MYYHGVREVPGPSEQQPAGPSEQQPGVAAAGRQQGGVRCEGTLPLGDRGGRALVFPEGLPEHRPHLGDDQLAPDDPQRQVRLEVGGLDQVLRGHEPGDHLGSVHRLRGSGRGPPQSGRALDRSRRDRPAHRTEAEQGPEAAVGQQQGGPEGGDPGEVRQDEGGSPGPRGQAVPHLSQDRGDDRPGGDPGPEAERGQAHPPQPAVG